MFDQSDPEAVFGIIVSTYETGISRSYWKTESLEGEVKIEDHYSNLNGLIWCVVCDEAHKARNPHTQTSCLIWEISAKVIILVTATPILYTKADLVGLLRLVWSEEFASAIIDRMGDEGESCLDEHPDMDLYEAIKTLPYNDPRRYLALDPDK